ncbi:MAG TPA: hypothetical protein DCY56_06770 [Candidatus Omnitrophica bacterium]|nr:hypothetical protein [Candidatus Omnitrophota bacterium]
MKATEIKLLDFLKGPKQFIIPIYQRTYSWTLKQCDQLWRDIIRAATDDTVSGHFVGSIVYIEKGLYQVSAIPQLLVIDGQQRLSTISLILSALGKAIETKAQHSDVTHEEITDYYLLNKHGKDELRYKLLLTQTDKTTLFRLVENKDVPEPFSKRIMDNYKFFEEQINQSNVDLMKIYQGITKLIIVDISLSRDHDNPQLIFESLNSTGLELSQADLIRNYVLMGLEPKEQESLYNDYWFQMEQGFGQIDYVTQFDRFMRDYLTIKTGSIPKINEVYEEFKAYVKEHRTISIKDIVGDIYVYAKHFVNTALEKESDEELRELFSDINILKVDVAYPFILEAYDDYKKKRISRDELIEILKSIESYVFRRAICGIPTNSLNKTFATLSRELDKTNYLESFKATLLLKDSYRRFPDDSEFIRELGVKDVYNFRSKNYLLFKLENYNRKEMVDTEGYTTEHIMPQNPNLSAEWRKDLGEHWKDIQSRYLHTLGNLTLTGYNPELSDKSFLEKRNMKGGFADSPIRLNRDLASLSIWNEAEIQKRAQVLAGIVTQVWGYPVLSEDVLTKYRKREILQEQTYTIDNYPHLTGEMRELFEQFRKHVLNLDSSVKEEMLKLYIAYKTTTNFVDVVPQKSRLRLALNMRFDEVIDPKNLCKDVTNLGRWGNGDVEVHLSSTSQLDDVMALVRQAFKKHVDNGDE